MNILSLYSWEARKHPFWRKVFSDVGTPHVAFNWLNALPRMPKTKPYLLEERFPSGPEILVDSGGFGAAKRIDDLDGYARRYTDWVAENIDRIDLVTEFDPEGATVEWLERWRHDFWEDIPPEKFVPIWHEEDGRHELERLCDTYERVGVTKSEQDMSGLLRSMVVRHEGLKLHGVAITKAAELRQVPYASAHSLTWISPTRNKDSHIWANGRLNYYPAKERAAARKRHAPDVRKAGFDELLYADDHRPVVARYTAWAWGQYEASIAALRERRGQLVSITGNLGDREPSEGTPDEPDNLAHKAPPPASPGALEPLKRDRKSVFPGLSVQGEKPADADDDDTRRIPVTNLAESGFRHCDACVLQARCPAFNPGHECAFNMPVKIRTKEQLLGTLTSAIEMQTARVAFARTLEEADGGAISKDVSEETQRLFEMVEKLKHIQEDTSFLRIEVQGKGQPGVLSALLGTALGQQARAQNDLDPDKTERFISNALDVPVKED